MASPRRIHFYKYQGVGDDFIMIDNRDGHFSDLSKDKAFTSWMCDRYYGIGANGILELRSHEGYDFEMVYTRQEGILSRFLCGNGSRCITAFANQLQVPCQGNKYHFLAADGAHVGWVDDITKQVHIKIHDNDNAQKYDAENFHIHVGNERHVVFVENLWDIDVIKEGRQIAYQERYMDCRRGCNVMFVQVEEDGNISARSFEANIDYEPLACGTGGVASSLINEYRKPWTTPKKAVKTKVTYKGGNFEVQFDHIDHGKFENVYLIGPARKSFEGYLEVGDFMRGFEYKYNKD